MDKSNISRNALNIVTNQPSRNKSKSIDPLAKIRPMISRKPHLVQPLSRPNTIQTSGLKMMLNTRIPSSDDSSYQPLVTISDNDHSDEEDFISPIQKLTKAELREELKVFKSTNKNQTSRALLTNDIDDDDDAGELQFRIEQPLKRSVCCYHYSFSFKESSCIIS